MLGTGNGVECVAEVKRAIWDDRDCSKEICPIAGIAPPDLSGGEFYAMSVYFYAIDCIRHHAIGDFSNW